MRSPKSDLCRPSSKGPIWQFSGKTDAVALGTVVLGERVIADAVRAQGYYIFQRIGFPG